MTAGSSDYTAPTKWAELRKLRFPASELQRGKFGIAQTARDGAADDWEGVGPGHRRHIGLSPTTFALGSGPYFVRVLSKRALFSRIRVITEYCERANGSLLSGPSNEGAT